MLRDNALAAGILGFLPGESTAGSLVWLLLILGVVGLLVSLFKR